jgi:flagellar hook-length control protein FliK
LQNVVPDSVVRPSRPEPAPVRAAVPAREPSGFDAMLDSAPSDTPRPQRPERPERTAPSERRDDPAPRARDESRANARPARDPAPPRKAERNSTKSADAPATRQAKNGQSSDKAAPDAQAQPTDEAPAVPAQPAAAQPVVAPAAVDLAAAVDVALADAGEAAPEADQSSDAKPVEDDSTSGDEPVAAATADAKPAETGIAAPVAVAVQAPTVPVPAPVAKPDLTAGIAPAEAGAKNPAPVPPSDEAQPNPEAPETAATPAKDAAPKLAADAAAQAGTKETGTNEQPAISAPVLPKEATDKTDAKTPAEPKAEAAKAKTDEAVRTAPAQPDVRLAQAPIAAPNGAPEPAAKPAHQPHAQGPEAAHGRSAPTEARADNSAATPSAPTTAAPGGAPIMPFNLASSPSLAAHAPLSALRTDPASNPVPIEGVAVEIVSRAQDGQKRFDIRLDPPELGRIDVRLDVDSGGKVTSRLVVERAETLDLLRRDAPQLERALQHAGLNTEGGLQFSLRDQSFGQRDQFPRESASVSHLIVPEDDTAAAEAARRGYGRLIGLGGGVDIRV